MGNNAPIGVFDSGIGGLTVVKEILSLMPGENIIYFGDTARTPYGSRPPAEIIKFMHQILHFFAAQKVKMAVIACNTMTALGLELARKQYPFLVVGVNTGVRTALKVSKNRHIGVIATQATVASGKHGKAAKAVDPNATIFPQACPKLVPLIEQEQIEGDQIDEALYEYLVPLQEAEVDAIILGCTHYPFVGQSIRAKMGDQVMLINPARDTAADARNMLARSGQLSSLGRGTARYCFSADPQRARRLASLIIDNPLPDFELINLEEY